MIGFHQRPSYQLYRHFLWADLIEILALINIDHFCSKSDFLDRLFPTKKDIDDSVLEGVEGDSLPSESTDDSVRDKLGKENLVEGIFLVIRHRINLYKEKYPFELGNDGIYARHDNKNIIPYAYLLLSSHLKVIKDKTKRQLLTSDFELLSFNVLRSYLGDRASVHIFAAGASRDQLFGEETKTLGEKYKKLSELYYGRFIGKADDPSLLQTSGDRGLDLTANFGFNDELNSRLIIYGQCKCSDEWSKKLFEASDDSLNEIIKFKSKPVSVMLTPFCFRGGNGGWAEDSMVRSTILFDRFRILEFINFDIVPVLEKSYSFITDFLSFTESIV